MALTWNFILENKMELTVTGKEGGKKTPPNKTKVKNSNLDLPQIWEEATALLIH